MKLIALTALACLGASSATADELQRPTTPIVNPWESQVYRDAFIACEPRRLFGRDGADPADYEHGFEDCAVLQRAAEAYGQVLLKRQVQKALEVVAKATRELQALTPVP